jgi:hypothetical protein
LSVLIVDDTLAKTVRSSSLDHELNFALFVQRGEQVRRLIDGVSQGKKSVVLQDAALVLGTQRRGDICAFFCCQYLKLAKDRMHELTIPPKL